MQMKQTERFQAERGLSPAAYLGGIFSLLPALGILGLLAAIYSIYLFYLGLPVLMNCPQEKAGAYTAVLVVCAIVAGLVLGAIKGAMHLGMGERDPPWWPFGSPSVTPSH